MGDESATSNEWAARNPEELFSLVKVIGQGNYGRVYKAVEKESGREVAIKILPMDEEDLENMKKLELEIQVLRRCDHECIVRYLGSYVKDNELWIVMEFCDAGSLAVMMSKQGKALEEPQIATVMNQMVQSLVYLHQQRMIHRDIKADNILMNSAGAAKLADLGVAAQLGGTMDQRRTATGTPYWMAPELVLEQEYNYKVDVWSLGITAIELADKKPPFFDMLPMRALFIIATGDKPPPTFAEPDKWSAEFNDFVNQCLVKDPAERASAIDLLEHPFIKGAPPKESMIDFVQEYIEAQEKKAQEKQERRKQADARREEHQRILIEKLQNLDTQSTPREEAAVHPFYPVCDACLSVREESPWANPMISGPARVILVQNDERCDLKFVPQLLEMLSEPHTGVKRTTRSKSLRTHKDCFVGTEAVTWFQRRLLLESRDQAVAIGEALMHQGKIYHVTRNEPFADSKSLFYRINDKEEEDDDKQMLGGKITYLVEMMRWGIEICDRKQRARTYHTCFIGSEAVDWIMSTLKMDAREDAVDVAQMLIDRSVFHHVNYVETFSDRKAAFYRFYQDDKKYPAVSSSTRTKAFQRANATMEEFLRTREKLQGILTASPQDVVLE